MKTIKKDNIQKSLLLPHNLRTSNVYKKIIKTSFIFFTVIINSFCVYADDTSSTQIEIENKGRSRIVAKATGYKEIANLDGKAHVGNGRADSECIIESGEIRKFSVLFYRNNAGEQGMEIRFYKDLTQVAEVGFHNPRYVSGRDIVQQIDKSTTDTSKLDCQDTVWWRFYNEPRDRVYIGLGNNL